MDSSPLISFIVPAYNIPHWMLRECVDSILAQPLSPDERQIIVVDDGSDVPVEQMDDVVLIRQNNGGLSAARNAALQVAKGEWVEFVDADDFLLPAWKNIKEFLHDTSLDVIRFGIETDSDKLHRTTAHMHLQNENLQAAACRYVFRRNVLGELRFTVGILHEDEEFTPLLLSQAGDMLVFGRRCYNYRKRSESIMHSADSTHIQRRLGDIEDVIIRLRDKNLPVLQRRIAQLTMDYVYNSLHLEHSLAATRKRTARLRKNNIWPLPKIQATFKYSLFRLLSKLL